jgi:hypothetical protein
LILFVVSLFLNQVFAQTIPFKIQKSQLFEDKYKKTSIVISEKDVNGDLLLVRSYNGNGITQNEGFYIEYYDQDLKLKRDFEFEMKHPRTQKYNYVLGVFYAEKNVQIIEIYYDLKRRTYVCQANTISDDFKVSKKELFSLTKEEIKYFDFSLEQKYYERSKEILDLDSSGSFSSESDTNFDFDFSSTSDGIQKNEGSNIIFTMNESKTAFAVALESNQEKKGGLKLYLFDNKLNKKIDTTFFKEKKENKYIFQNIQVSKNGEAIYILAKSYTNETKKKDKGGKYDFELTKISIEEQKTQSITTNEHFIGSLRLFFHNEDLICLGFSSNLSDNKYSGISYFKLNANSLNIVNSKHNAFTQQFIFDKYGKSKEKKLKYLTFRKVFFTPSDDLILNAEEEYTVTTAYGGYSPYGGVSVGSTRDTYRYDDIVSLKINQNGDLIWARNINKKQYQTTEDFYVSYSSMIKENENFFFINSGEKPKEISNSRIEFTDTRKNKSNLNLIRIKENGDFDYQEILDHEQNEVPFMVSRGIIIDNSIYFLGRRGWKKQLLKISL